MQTRPMKSWKLFVSLFAVSQAVSFFFCRSIPWKTSFEMTYGMGLATQGLIEQHRLGFILSGYEWWAYALRMPLIPCAAALVYRISSRFLVYYFLKNLICWSAWIYAVLRLRKYYKIPDILVLFIALVIVVLPLNASVASHAEFEEGYLVAMLNLLLVLLLVGRRTTDYIEIGVLVALIYLTKSSMVLVCAVAVAWAAVAQWSHSRIRALIPAAGLALAISMWGGYTYLSTGVFAFGMEQSSWNGWNFYKANNPRSVDLYPRTNLDTLDDDDSLMPGRKVRNEWEMSRAQFALGNQFVHDHPGMVMKMDAKKFYVFCCDLQESPEASPGHSRGVVVFSSLVDHLVLTLCIFFIGLRILKHRVDRSEVLSLLVLVAYMAPYFAGWLYMRHMVPIYDIFVLVLAIQLTTWKNGIKANNAAILASD